MKNIKTNEKTIISWITL